MKSIFARAGEFAVVSVSNDPVESDFHSVANQVFVFEYTGNFDIEEIEGLCVGLPITNESGLLDEAVEWLGTFGKACYSPDDDYDCERQEEDFGDSISCLILELRGNVLSTNWSFHELKTLVEKIVGGNGKIVAVKSGENQNHPQIKGIEFLSGNGETKMIVKLANETEIALNIASHTYLN